MSIQQLGPYVIESQLGQGGMGRVYVGRHEQTGERVAVKVLSLLFSGDPRFRERFRNEIETLKTLDHPHIVKLYGFGEYDGHLFYSMELVCGSTLQAELKAGRRFDWREAVSIGVQICGALKHAHDHGVIHRDLKPANLLLDENEQVKLTDFGIAKLFGANPVTAEGGVLGTADYMSPEQAEGQSVSSRTDLYALGSVLYALLVGRPPFAAQTMAEVMRKLVSEAPRPLSRINPDVPREFERIIGDLLAKDPGKRPATARVVANQLKAMEYGLSLDTKVTVDPPQSGDDMPTPADVHDSIELFSHNLELDDDGLEDAMTVDMPPDSEPQSSVAIDGAADLDLSGQLSANHTVPDHPPIRQPKIREFTSVDPDQPQAATDTRFPEERMSWVQLAAGLGLVAIVLVSAGWMWNVMQPPSADQLYARIQAKAAETDVESLLDVEAEIGRFLNSYADDERAAELQQYQRDIDSLRLYRRLSRKAARVGGTDYLAPVEQAFVVAMREKQNSFEMAYVKFGQLVDVFGHEADASLIQRQCVKLAKHQLQTMTSSRPPDHNDSRSELTSLLERAEQQLTAAALERFRRGIIGLYGDKPWARDVVQRCQAALGEQPD